MDKIRVGVIGTGALGRHHTRLYGLNEHAALQGIYDVSRDAAQKVAAEFGTNVFDSIEELASHCDALSVAVPATLHYEVVQLLLSLGKHVLTEKPIASTVEQARSMVQLAEEKKLVFGVGHVERFNPAMEYLAKHPGRTLFIEVHRLAKYPPARLGMLRRGTEVSVVLDLMIHDLDLILKLVPSEIDRIEAFGAAIMSKTVDMANVRLSFRNGCVANVTASRMSPDPMRRFRVFRDDSYASMDLGAHTGNIYRKTPLGITRKTEKLDEVNALANELDDFLTAVRSTMETGTLVRPRVTGEDGLNALELAVRIENEIAEHNRKYFIPAAGK